MTTQTEPRYVQHTPDKINLGTGLIVRFDGSTHVFVQWRGIWLVRREHLEDLLPAPKPVL
jgi:hypothetical protein